MMQSPGWKKLAARMVWNHYSDVPWVLRHKRSRRLTCGAAGIARLRWSMLDRKLPLWLYAPMRELLTDGRGVWRRALERDGARVDDTGAARRRSRCGRFRTQPGDARAVSAEADQYGVERGRVPIPAMRSARVLRSAPPRG